MEELVLLCQAGDFFFHPESYVVRIRFYFSVYLFSYGIIDISGLRENKSSGPCIG
ncbi:hypothetical protein ES703_85625 [subsurface metagenome]